MTGRNEIIRQATLYGVVALVWAGFAVAILQAKSLHSDSATESQAHDVTVEESLAAVDLKFLASPASMDAE